MPSDRPDQPIVDVLLPVYNGAETIAESVESLLAQTEKRLRVLVIDDGSTDDTPRILDELSQRDDRVVVIRTPNGGIVAALNLGLEKSTAPFIARQDADDISFPDRIEKQLAVFNANPETVALSGSCVHIDKSGKPTGTTYKVRDPAAADYTTYPSTEPYLLHPFLMVRADAFKAVNGYRYVIHSEDTDLYWRLRDIGPLMNIDEPYGQMRLHDGSISNASVVNGRIMAIMSQLAAVSARRREEGRTDIEFPSDAKPRLVEARSLERLLDLLCRDLDGDEAHYVRYASAVGLLDMALSRSYELEAEDCRFIRQLYARIPARRFRGRTTVAWAYRTTLLRYLAKRRIDNLMAIFDFGAASRSVLLRFT